MNRKFEEILADAEKVEAIKEASKTEKEKETIPQKLVNIYTMQDRAKKIPQMIFNGYKSMSNSKFLKWGARKISPKIGNLAENGINLAGKIMNKDFSRSAKWANRMLDFNIKDFHGAANKKSIARQAMYNRTSAKLPKVLKTTKKYVVNKYNKYSEMWKKVKAKPVNLLKSKVFDKTRNLFSKIKNVGKPNKFFSKIFKGKKPVLSKIGKFLSKPLKLGKNGLGSVGKNLAKSFSLAPIGFAANTYTMLNDKSNFKRVLAGIDIAGDAVAGIPVIGTAVSGATSTLNFLGSLGYDYLNSKNWGKSITETLDNVSGKYIVDPIAKGYGYVKNKSSQLLKSAKNKFGKLGSFISSKLGFRKKDIANGLSKHKIRKHVNTPYKPIQNIMPKVKNGTIDLYNNLKNNKSFNIKPNYKNQGTSNHNLNKNNFTINISGNGLSVDEIANQLASRIQTTMENVYA